jgi:hypothetical protein
MRSVPLPHLSVVAIYPKDFWSEHPMGVVDREWGTPAHREFNM